MIIRRVARSTGVAHRAHQAAVDVPDRRARLGRITEVTVDETEPRRCRHRRERRSHLRSERAGVHHQGVGHGERRFPEHAVPGTADRLAPAIGVERAARRDNIDPGGQLGTKRLEQAEGSQVGIDPGSLPEPLSEPR